MAMIPMRYEGGVHIDTPIDISTYKTSSNKYTCPSDGYVRTITSASTAGSAGLIYIGSLIVNVPKSTDIYRNAFYVRKGMQIYSEVTSDVTTLQFIPLANN